MTVADSERFTSKGKLVTYIGAFIKLYNQKNHEQVHKIHGIIEFEKMHALNAENPRNHSAFWIIEILSVLRNAHVILRNQDKFVFYVNNFINQDQFNQLYNLDSMNKGIRNTDVIGSKFRPALTKAINHKLKVASKER